MSEHDDWEARNPYWRADCAEVDLTSVEAVFSAILSDDAEVINFFLYEARARSMLLPLFHKLAEAPPPRSSVRAAFHSAWVNQGLRIRENFEVDQILFDVLAKVLPGYKGLPVSVFRGERSSNHTAGTYGPSWTTKRTVAEDFASVLNCCPVSGGLLLRTVAPEQAILAAPNDHSHHLGEGEYILDRRLLGQIEVLQEYAPRRTSPTL